MIQTYSYLDGECRSSNPIQFFCTLLQTFHQYAILDNHWLFYAQFYLKIQIQIKSMSNRKERGEI